MSLYTAESCKYCGGKIIESTIVDTSKPNYINTVRICSKCGNKVQGHSPCVTASTAGTSTTSISLADNCPVCGTTLSIDDQYNKECYKCGYSSKTYIGDLPTDDYSNTDTNHTSVSDNNVSTNIYDTEKFNLFGEYGWICPKCGSVMAPHMNFCIKCSGGPVEITYSTSNTLDGLDTVNNYNDENIKANTCFIKTEDSNYNEL